jgi:parallel beta-helix repeat protein
MTGESNDHVENNTISFFRQHGMDIASCTSCVIETNTVSDSDLANLSLADSSGGTVKFNQLYLGGRWLTLFGNGNGSLTVASNTTSTMISQNDILGNPGGGPGNWAVWFFENGMPCPGTACPSSNVVISNDFWSGLPTGNYTGGNYPSWNSANTFSANTNH